MGRIFKPKRKRKDGTTWVSPRWWIEYRNEMRRVTTEPASTDKKLAQSLLRKAEERVERVRLGLEAPQAEQISLQEIGTRFLEDMALHLRPKTMASYKQTVTALVLGDKKGPAKILVKKVSELRPAVIKDYQSKMAGKVANRTINRQVTILKTMLNWAVESQLIRANPIMGVRMLPKKPVRVQRALTEEEIHLLMKAADEEGRELWTLFLDTGMRKGEMATLRWKDIDLEGKVITVRPEIAKNRKERRIPMSQAVLAILKRRFESTSPGPTDLVVPKIRNQGLYHYARDEFMRDIKKAGINPEGIHIHALRRTFATRLIRSGADPKTVQAILGHATLELTLQLYTDAKALDLRSAIERLPELTVSESRGLYRATG